MLLPGTDLLMSQMRTTESANPPTTSDASDAVVQQCRNLCACVKV